MADLDPRDQFTPPLDPADISPPPRRRRWYEYLGLSRTPETIEPPPVVPSPAPPPSEPTSPSVSQTPNAGPRPEGPVRKQSDLKQLQRYKNYLAMGAVGALLVLGLLFLNRTPEEPVHEDPTKRGQAGTILPNIDRDRENWIVRSDALFQKQQKDIDELKKQTEADRKQLDDLMQAIKQSGGAITSNPDGTVSLKLPPTKDKEDTTTPSLPPPPKSPTPQLPAVATPPADVPSGLQEPPLAPTIRSFKPIESSAAVPNQPGNQTVKPNTIGSLTPTMTGPMPLNQTRIGVREDDMWIPSGTFIKARLLSGLVAPTGTRASQNPHPVLLELLEDGMGPNKIRLPMKDCFVVGSAVGDLSSERALIRTEALSCVRPDMTTVDIDMKGYVAGDDGIAGIRGTVVSKQGSLIAQSLLAGFAKGISDVMRFQSSSVVMTPTGIMQSIDPNQAVKGGALGGVGNSMDRLAHWYISLAEEIFPVIEVSAGRTVDVVVTKGFIPL